MMIDAAHLIKVMDVAWIKAVAVKCEIQIGEIKENTYLSIVILIHRVLYVIFQFSLTLKEIAKQVFAASRH